MNILITGGAGYIGSHVVRAALRAGHEPFAYDNLSHGHCWAVAEDRLILGDLAEGAWMRDILAERRIEAVIHMAALTSVARSVEDPAAYWRTNVVGSFLLLEAMRDCGVSKLVFSSSAAVYGVPNRTPIAEDAHTRPVNPYGFTKLAVERALADYARAYGLGYAALRYFNAAGAATDGLLGEAHRPETHLIPVVLEVASGEREAVPIFGEDFPTPDGTAVRDYIHVEDLAGAHVLALDRLQPGGGLTLNLGTGRGYSVREVIDVCRRVSGRPIPTKSHPRRPGDPAVLVADASRAGQLLGWRPNCLDLELIVESAWRWHRRAKKEETT